MNYEEEKGKKLKHFKVQNDDDVVCDNNTEAPVAIPMVESASGLTPLGMPMVTPLGMPMVVGDSRLLGEVVDANDDEDDDEDGQIVWDLDVTILKNDRKEPVFSNGKIEVYDGMSYAKVLRKVQEKFGATMTIEYFKTHGIQGINYVKVGANHSKKSLEAAGIKKGDGVFITGLTNSVVPMAKTSPSDKCIKLEMYKLKANGQKPVFF